MSDKIQVIIVDDHPLFREGLILTLRAEPDIEVVGQATTADEAVSLVGELLPDVVLLDITIPGSGLKAASLIAAHLAHHQDDHAHGVGGRRRRLAGPQGRRARLHP